MNLPSGVFFTQILRPSRLSIAMSILYRQPPLPALCTLLDKRTKPYRTTHVAVPLHELVQHLNAGDRT